MKQMRGSAPLDQCVTQWTADLKRALPTTAAPTSDSSSAAETSAAGKAPSTSVHLIEQSFAATLMLGALALHL
jgi:hypothetical protein